MFNLHNDGYPYAIFAWLLFAIATPLVAIRLYVQLRFRSRPWRELYVFTAWLLYLGFTITISVQNDWDWYNESATRSFRNYKMDLASILMFLPILYFCKFSLLCLYGDLIQRHSFPVIWWTILVSWFLCVAGLLIVVIDDLLQCRPLNLYWLASVPGSTIRCERPYSPAKVFLWLLHIGTDVIVYVVPMVILYRHRDWSTQQKRGGLALMALGTLNVASALALGASYLSPTLNHHYAYNVAMCYLIPFQAGSAVIIICLPYCRRFWRGADERTLMVERQRTSVATMPAAAHMMTQTYPSDLESGEAASATSNERISVTHKDAAF